MLSLGKISLTGENYYLNAVADGTDEYFRGVGEAPGRWAGTASDKLGLEGEVGADDLHSIWAGLDPTTGEPLGTNSFEQPCRGPPLRLGRLADHPQRHQFRGRLRVLQLAGEGLVAGRLAADRPGGTLDMPRRGLEPGPDGNHGAQRAPLGGIRQYPRPAGRFPRRIPS